MIETDEDWHFGQNMGIPLQQKDQDHKEHTGK
jgi:hypothetical protein